MGLCPILLAVHVTEHRVGLSFGTKPHASLRLPSSFVHPFAPNFRHKERQACVTRVRCEIECSSTRSVDIVGAKTQGIGDDRIN